MIEKGNSQLVQGQVNMTGVVEQTSRAISKWTVHLFSRQRLSRQLPFYCMRGQGISRRLLVVLSSILFLCVSSVYCRTWWSNGLRHCFEPREAVSFYFYIRKRDSKCNVT